MATRCNSPEVVFLSLLPSARSFRGRAFRLFVGVVLQLLVAAGADSHHVRAGIAGEPFTRGRRRLVGRLGRRLSCGAKADPVVEAHRVTEKRIVHDGVPRSRSLPEDLKLEIDGLGPVQGSMLGSALAGVMVRVAWW